MDVEELQSLTMTLPVTSPFAVSWSDDDRVSVMTAKGIYVLVFQPAPYEYLPVLDFKRSWIPVPLKIPTDNLGIDPNDFVHKLEKDDACSLVADISISPSLESADTVIPHPVQVEWSHSGMLYYRRCILASLTNMGLVSFHIMVNNQWIVIFDFVETLRKHFQNYWEENSHNLKPYKQFCLLKNRVNELKTLAIGWSPTFGSRKSYYSYFLNGQGNGNIIIWKIPSVVGETFQSNPEILITFDSKLQRITCLSWFCLDPSHGVIIAGDHSGVITFFKYELDENNENKVNVEYLGDIWPEKDNISVKKVDCLGKGPNLSERYIIAIKGNFLVVMSVDNDGKLLDRSSAHMGSFNIVGYVPYLEDFSIMVMTQRGGMTSIKLDKNYEKKINFEVNTINSNLDMSEKLSFGMACSQNKMIWFVASSVYKPYDHLVIRELSTATIFTLNCLPNPLSILRNNHTRRLTSYWDCLELYRLLLARGREFDVPLNIDDLYNRDSYHLLCDLWTVTIYSKFLSQGNEVSNEMTNSIKKCEDAIFLQHSYKVLQSLLSSEVKSLNEMQLQSFGLFYKWLKQFIAECDVGDNKKFLSLLKDIEQKNEFVPLLSEELCGLCGENVKMNSWNFAVCDAVLPNKSDDSKRKGHSIPRCSLSLLQCLTLSYRICFICSALANGELVHDEDPICTFCNGNLNLDDRVNP